MKHLTETSRHDSNPEVAAQLMDDYVEANGIRLPSRRRAYLRGTDSRPSLDPPLVSIAISGVRFSCCEGTTREQNAALLPRLSGGVGRQGSKKHVV